MDLARLPPAEPASTEAMRLLCIATRDYYYYLDLPGITIEQALLSADCSRAGQGTAKEDAGDGSDLPGSHGAVIGGELARLGAGMVALAHLKVPEPPSPVGISEARLSTRGFSARFVGWICNVAPEVFPDLRDRGLLEALIQLLLSSTEAERPDVEIAVAILAIQVDETRIPLRALRAITPLTEKLKVRPGVFTHSAQLHCCQNLMVINEGIASDFTIAMWQGYCGILGRSGNTIILMT